MLSKTPSYRALYERELRKRNPEYHERQKLNCRLWRQENIEYVRNKEKIYARSIPKERRFKNYLSSKWGITTETYNNILQKQNGKCAICFKVTKRRLHLDHDHRTNEIRGLLCFRCNYGLSWFSENKEVISRAGKYLCKKVRYGKVKNGSNTSKTS